MNKLSLVLGTLGASALALAVSASQADAFCGFYVEGSGAKLAADATQVTLMRLCRNRLNLRPRLGKRHRLCHRRLDSCSLRRPGCWRRRSPHR